LRFGRKRGILAPCDWAVFDDKGVNKPFAPGAIAPDAAQAAQIGQ
jgi:hypothetical protein